MPPECQLPSFFVQTAACLRLVLILMLCRWTDLRPGSIVCESGTGSGSLTHSLARAVSPGDARVLFLLASHSRRSITSPRCFRQLLKMNSILWVHAGGHVNTFEYHDKRAAAAEAEFKANGLEGTVTIQCRDVEANGFGEDLHGKVRRHSRTRFKRYQGSLLSLSRNLMLSFLLC